MYAKITLSTGTLLGTVSQVPQELLGLDVTSLADLSWADVALGYQGIGFWPIEEERAPLGFGERQGEPVLTVDKGNRRVIRHWPVVAMTQEEVEALKAQALNEAREAALQRINEGYDATVAALVSTYPKREVDTFTKQEQEAVAWLADNTAPTPFVDGMLVTRDIEKAELMNRIIAKADVFTDATGQLTGKRQTLEKQIESATTVEEVEAIQW